MRQTLAYCQELQETIAQREKQREDQQQAEQQQGERQASVEQPVGSCHIKSKEREVTANGAAAHTSSSVPTSLRPAETSISSAAV